MNKNDRIKTAKKVALALSRNKIPSKVDLETLKTEGVKTINQGTFLAIQDTKTKTELALKYPKRGKKTVYAYDLKEYMAYVDLTERLAKVETAQEFRSLEGEFWSYAWNYASLKNELEEGFDYIYHEQGFDKTEEPEEAALWEEELSQTPEKAPEEPALASWENAVTMANIGLDGVEFKVTSVCLWAGGKTKAHKDALKAAGFRWAPKRKEWYFKIPTAA